MDIFATAVLQAVVANLKRPQTWFLTNFFPEVSQSTTEEIYFDTENKSRRMTPFVSPLVAGKIVESEGFATNHFKPAYTKDKRVFDPNRALKRAIGETIGGSMDPQDRVQMNLATELADQVEMLMRRKEWMGVQALRTGKVTVTGEGFPTVVVDFGRHADHSKTLLSTAKWSDAGSTPVDDIEDWGLEMQQRCGAGLTDVVMDPKAWRLFRKHADVKDLLDTRRGSLASIESAMEPGQLGARFQGDIGTVRYWTYQDWYLDDNDVEQTMLPDYTVLPLSRQIDGVQHQGAIRDEKAGFQAMEYYPKSWVVEDPSVRYLLMQSAPLVVPYRPNASMAITVHS